MTDINYNHKHVFLAHSSCKFICNLLTNLISKNVIDKSSILLVVYGENSIHSSIRKKCLVEGLELVEWKELKGEKCSFLTLNSLSLQYMTAEIIIDCINLGYVKVSKVSILITDDEIDRWHESYVLNGCLKIDDASIIDQNVLDVLNTVDNYIVPYNPFGSRLEEIANRNLNIIDAILPFTILNYNTQSDLEKLISKKDKLRNEAEYKILIYTKPWSQNISAKWFLAILLDLITNKNYSSKKKITLSVWFDFNLRGFLLFKALVFIIKIKKIPITLDFKKTVSDDQYFLMLHDHDCLILQDRGGFSTAKYFAEKIGKVITLTDSFNYLSFKNDYNIDIDNANNFKGALRTALECNEHKNFDEFSISISQRNNESLKVLYEYWNIPRLRNH